MPLAQVNGVNLRYEIAGDSGERIVLVHGSWGNHANWDAVVHALAQSFRVLTYDRRGHSQSEPASGEGTFNQDVDDLGALIQQLDFAPALIVGNSFGAIVVLGLAGRRPDLFRGLSVHEPPALGLLAGDPTFAPMLEQTNQRIGAVLELIREGDAAGAAERFVETVAVGPGAWAQLPPALRQTFIENASTFRDESRDPDWLAPDLEALSRFTHPALLTQGDQSPPFFPAIIAKVHAALPQAQVQTIAGASHIPHVSHPHEFVEMLSAFARQPAPS
ncbi:MAG: 3-oxoadipate enol-lactonase [Chloroflexota bacterium]